MNAPSPTPMASTDWPVDQTVCEFCVKETRLSPLPASAQGTACPACGATLRDRVLGMALIAAFSESGDLRISKFVGEKHSLGLKFGSIGNAFSQPKLTGTLIDFPFRDDLRDVAWRRPGTAPATRIPLKDALLDAMIVHNAPLTPPVLAEIRRVLRPAGLLMVPTLPARGPGQTPADLAARAREAGFVTHFHLPGAGIGQAAVAAVLMAVAPGAVAT